MCADGQNAPNKKSQPLSPSTPGTGISMCACTVGFTPPEGKGEVSCELQSHCGFILVFIYFISYCPQHFSVVVR